MAAFASYINEIKERFKESAKIKNDIAKDDEQLLVLNSIANMIIRAYKNDNKILIFGNGGSAADAQHIAAELVSKFKMNRKGLQAIALTTNTSVITAIGNDFTFDQIFDRQVEAFAKRGDVVIGISTSGESNNVILGLMKADKMGCYTIAFTGKKDNRISMFSVLTFNVPSKDTARIQEAHITAGHIICEIVERELFS
ncbi:D-sedoheptulose 7-phosphate isomerase [Sulfuricurvum sp.]|uniref:D-sedoheptulose 7-phosphate isomerase n=1 Tax=Sulfuricurvum sp. TaxID=2025608 RepID=UPI003566F3DE